MVWCEQREQAFESWFARDQELIFQINARYHRHMGLWAACMMKLSQQDTRVYADELVHFAMTDPSEESLVEKMKSDLAKADVAVTRRQLRKHVKFFSAQAHREICDGYNPWAAH